MNVAKEAKPARIDSPDAVARHQPDLGDATDDGDVAAENVTLSGGTDISTLLEGPETDLCQTPHSGCVVGGVLTVTDTDGSEGVDESGDVFDWPPVHTVRADEDTDSVLSSPRHEHGVGTDHVRDRTERA